MATAKGGREGDLHENSPSRMQKCLYEVMRRHGHRRHRRYGLRDDPTVINSQPSIATGKFHAHTADAVGAHAYALLHKDIFEGEFSCNSPSPPPFAMAILS